MSNRKPLRGFAKELAADIARCRAALDRGELSLAQKLEREVYLSVLRHVAGGNRRARRLAFMSLALPAEVDARVCAPRLVGGPVVHGERCSWLHAGGGLPSECECGALQEREAAADLCRDKLGADSEPVCTLPRGHEGNHRGYRREWK